MFRVADHKGVAISFPNGWTVSALWGPGDYCDHHRTGEYEEPRAASTWSSTTAEVAIIYDKDRWYNLEVGAVVPGGSHVEGWITPERFADILDAVRKLAAP